MAQFCTIKLCFYKLQSDHICCSPMWKLDHIHDMKVEGGLFVRSKIVWGGTGAETDNRVQSIYMLHMLER